MFSRVLYKEKAKETYRKFTLIAIVVGFFLFIISSASDVNFLDLTRDSSEQSWQWLYSVPMAQPLQWIITLSSVTLAFISLVLRVFLTPIATMLTYYFKQLSNGNKEISLGRYFKNGLYLKLIIVLVLSSIGISIGFVLLVIPGIYLTYAWRYVGVIAIDNPHLSTQEIFKRSMAITNGKKFDLFVMDLSFLGWYFLVTIIGMLTFGLGYLIGSVVLQPYTTLTDMEAYKAMEFDY